MKLQEENEKKKEYPTDKTKSQDNNKKEYPDKTKSQDNYKKDYADKGKSNNKAEYPNRKETGKKYVKDAEEVRQKNEEILSRQFVLKIIFFLSEIQMALVIRGFVICSFELCKKLIIRGHFPWLSKYRRPSLFAVLLFAG